jgi:formylmethanofuran dehydrogenase subunit C
MAVIVASTGSVIAAGSVVAMGSVAVCTGSAVVVEGSITDSPAWAASGIEEEPRTASTTPAVTTAPTAMRINQVALPRIVVWRP